MENYTKTELNKKTKLELTKILFELTGNTHSYIKYAMIENILKLQLNN